MQLAILRRRNPREYLHLGGPAAAGISQHIEVAQQRFAIGQNGDLAAAFASARRTLRSLKGLGKEQVQFVHARLQGNVVAEISLPAAAIDDRILCLDTMSAAELEKAGDEARSQKDYDHAIQYFHAALRKDRKNAGLYNKLGLAELKNNDLSAARSDFERAAKRNSKYPEAVNN